MEIISYVCSDNSCQSMPELLCNCQDPPLTFCRRHFDTHLLDRRPHPTESATWLTPEQLAETQNQIQLILRKLKDLELKIITTSHDLIKKITRLSRNALNQIDTCRKSLYSNIQVLSNTLCFEKIRESINKASSRELQSNFDLQKIDQALDSFFSPSRLFNSELCINSHLLIDVRFKSRLTSNEKKLRLLMNAGLSIDNPTQIVSLIYSQQQEILFVGYKSAAVTVIDLTARNLLRSTRIGSGSLELTDAFIFPSNRSMLLVCKDSLIILDLTTLGVLAERRMQIEQLKIIEIFPIQNIIVTGSYNGMITLWSENLDQTHEYNAHSFGFFGSVSCIRVASNESFIVSGGFDGKIAVWKFANAPHLFLAHNECILKIFVAPNCRIVISVSEHKIKLWDFSSNYQLIWEKKISVQNLVFGVFEDLTQGFMTGEFNKQIYVFNFISNREQARIETKEQLAQWSNQFQGAYNFTKFLKKK